ncbi:MAG: xylan 1,4-beta-xylosidase [Actinobacteria bacterium]|nr:xylan 1,4-beta-xylosidase [Actinomycetota bacterium]
MTQLDPRADWDARISLRTAGEGGRPTLAPPAGLTAAEGAGQVTLRWHTVPGAIGYLVHAADSPEGPFRPIDHGGGDVLAVPGPPYADTTGEQGRPRWYAVASLAAAEGDAGPVAEDDPGPLSIPTSATPGSSPAAPLVARVDAASSAGRLQRLWHMLGSERLSQILSTDRTGGVEIGPDFAAALRLARAELGADRVRAHAILHDDLGVYREDDGEPRYDFAQVERTYDAVLATGLRPVVELSFMPRDLARDPQASVFEYRGLISPPRDWERWGELVRKLAAHLVARYGIDEVRRWGFEVWNEANLEVFWAGSREEYFQLYDVAVRAVKSVDERLLVGGPATAAAGWVREFLDFVAAEDSPLDFFSTHTYGNFPLDVREALGERGLDRVEIWWTEWGVTPRHFAGVTDLAFGAPFVLHGMKRTQGRAEALAYWVVSDHFEELGRPHRLFHGGFGLLTVGSLRKPRYWALALAEELGDELVELALAGDGAGSLVDGWASRHEDGTVDVLLWNGTLDHSKVDGGPLLDRRVELSVEGLDRGHYRASLARVDARHSNIAAHWGEKPWPAEDEWGALRAADRLHEEPVDAHVSGGVFQLELELPLPGVARLRLTPG